jgi:sortase B
LGCVFLAAALAIVGSLIYGYVTAQQYYKQVLSASGLAVTDSAGEVSPDTSFGDLNLDWTALKAVNPDIVAWVLIPGTNINYPIVQGDDNDYYLTHLSDDSYSRSGAVFLDSLSPSGLDGANNMIYGHNMRDGSMFANINKFTSQDFFDAHRTIYLCTPERNMELQTFACERMSGNAPIRIFQFATNDDLQDYVQTLLANAVATAGDTGGIQQVYSFITCNNGNDSYRVLLSAKPVRTQAAQ